MPDARKQSCLLYAGTYTAKTSKGIYLFRFDEASGALTPLGLAAETPNPTFLALHPSGRFLYSVCENRDARGRHDGAVSAYAVEAPTGRLAFLNAQPSQGVGPCHVSVNGTGRVALVANYASGSVGALPIAPDGRLGAATAAIQHRGASVNPERQAGPHAHAITPAPDNRFALAADLGLDRVIVYRLDAAAGRLQPHAPAGATVKPGAGPRHLAFHPRRPFVYLINELDSTVIVFEWDAARGALRELQTVSTLPAGYRGASFPAEVCVAADGRFLYGSNRGHDSLAVFSIDAATGRLTALGCQSTLGQHPRHFALHPSGQWLLVANQDTDNIVVFRRDADTGRLEPAGRATELSMPVCVCFFRDAAVGG